MIGTIGYFSVKYRNYLYSLSFILLSVKFGYLRPSPEKSPIGFFLMKGGWDPGLGEMEVILRERNKGMNEIDDPSILQEERIFGFGNKGPLMVQSCMMEKTSEDREPQRAILYKLSYSSSIILETIPFHHRRESFEGLSNHQGKKKSSC